MALHLYSHKVLRVHLCIILFLILASLTGDIIHSTTGHDYIFGLRPLFNVLNEKNIPSLFSSFAILCSAAFLFVLHHRYRKSNLRGSGYFLFLGLVFVFLAYDEAFSVHERLNTSGNQLVTASGLFYFAWIVPASLFVLLIFVCSVGFLRRTDARTRNLLILSGTIFVGGAVGFEALSGLRLDIAEISVETANSRPDLIYLILATFEEMLEMIGIALFIFTLVGNYQRNFGPFAIRIG